MLGLRVLAMYATDRQMDGRTDGQKQSLLPLRYRWRHKKYVEDFEI